jgi:multidrug/hemolysin transport system ATP-binding protein
MKKIIEVNKLVKSYGSVLAVNDISFDVEKGDFFAFLGTNGAGKSTTINILTTLVKQNSGNIYVNGHELGKDDLKIRNDIGVVFQNGVLDDLLTVKENLMVRSSFYKLSGKELKNRIAEAARITECHDIMNRRYGKLSGGQKRRVDIARAIINRPKLLFLDEPTTGLDPKTRKSIWNAIKKMQNSYEMSIFLTTHYMEEAANADKVLIIKKGEIVTEGTPISLKEKYAVDLLKIYNPSESIRPFLDKMNLKYDYSTSVVVVKVESPQITLQVLKYIEEKDQLTSFEVIHGTLDDVFLKVMEENLEAEHD